MRNKAYIALFISIISVSFAAIFITTLLNLYPETEPLSIAFYRLLFTSLIVLPFVVLQSKTRKEITNIPRPTFLIMVIIGIILSVHFAFWITSLKYTSVGSSVILVTAHPILVGPVSHYFFKERLSIVNTIGIIVSVTGVIILVYGNYGLGSFTVDSLEGNILAILGGAAAGLYILGGRKIRKTVSVWSYAFIVYSIGTIGLLIICLFYSVPLNNLSFEALIIIFVMAIVAGIFGHTLYNWSLKHIRASVASVVLLGEPLGSTLFAFALPWIQQTPSYYTILGGAIILSGIYLTTRKLTTLKIRNF
jgi:drug/metabolite transporter (DMT)-like permease